MMRRFLSCLLIAAILAALTPGASPLAGEPSSPGLAAMRAVYAQARAGTLDLEEAETALTGFLEDNPDHPVATAFLGSVKAMIARDAFFPFKKLAYVNLGTELLDAAVADLDRLEPEADYDGRLDVLMVGGLTNAGLPTLFGRRPMAERDLRRLIALPGFAALPSDARARAYTWLAVIVAPRSDAEAQRLLAAGRTADSAVADALWSREQ